MAKIQDDPYPTRRKARWPVVVAIVGGIVGVLVLVGWYALQSTLLPKVEEAGHRTESSNNIRQISTILAEQSIRKGWPKLTGKAFVLSLIASGVIDAENPANLRIFFSPADERRGVDRVSPDRWRHLTKAALAAGGDFDDLTSYAGPSDVLGRSAGKTEPVPILADLHFEDVVIVGFVDGSVRTMTREDLGLAPGDALIVGPTSKSEILRALSEE